MVWLVWIGAAFALAGLCGLGWCITAAAKARRTGLQGQAMQDRLRRLVVVNLSAMGLSALGLMMVVVGVMLT
ncbi:hypothetical protein [Jannaschia sp. LMIT008]|uniref:hypothetical protein n=1 Tax=Jannaschia maritima TaxID=3032585 RepID=UPI00281220E0|nr:hypothetical protein [Jannaschia sp. LMIT008]